MRRWLPYPRISLSLLLMWLALNQSLAVGQILLGMFLAWLLPRLLARAEPASGGGQRPWLAVRLLARVLVDITHSNIAVARIILSLRTRERHSGFVHIPLAMRNPNALAVLAAIITATPGTIWVDYDGHSGVLIIHVLDLADEGVWIDIMQRRYGLLLQEIFP